MSWKDAPLVDTGWRAAPLLDEPEKEADKRPELMQRLQNIAAGGIRGAGSIGATLLAPLDAAARAAGIENSFIGRTDRREAMNEALRDLMGADPDAASFGLGKAGAEVVGTLGVGPLLGMAAKATPLAQAMPRLTSALSTGGMTTGSPVTNRAADMGIRMAGGAGMGGASAALVNPEETGAGAAIGALLPPGLRALGAAGTLLGGAARRALATVSNPAATNIAARNIGEALGPGGLPQRGGLPLSVGALTQNPQVVQMEQASRLRAPGTWQDFDQRQAGSVWDAVKKATGEADQLSQARDTRAENWRGTWDAAAAAFKPGAPATPSQIKAAMKWPKDVQNLSAFLDDKMKAPEAANSNVAAMLSSVRSKLESFGDSFSPAHLQQIRADLSGKAWAGANDPLKAAPRDSPATIALLRKVDDMLNEATGGKWQKVVSGYAKDSEAVNAARAAGKVRGAFVDQETGRLLKPAADAAGDVPRVTEAGLTSAMNMARAPNRAPMLSGGAQSGLGDVLEALRAQAAVQRMKRSATAGGDSGTASNLMSLAPTPGWIGGLLDVGRRMSSGRIDAATAGLLTDPDALARMLGMQTTSGLLDPALLAAVYRASPALAADR